MRWWANVVTPESDVRGLTVKICSKLRLIEGNLSHSRIGKAPAGNVWSATDQYLRISGVKGDASANQVAAETEAIRQPGAGTDIPDLSFKNRLCAPGACRASTFRQ